MLENETQSIDGLNPGNKYLKILGNFQGTVPELFGKVKVYDLRAKKGALARWGYIDHPKLSPFFVVLDPLDQDVYGDVVSGAESIKWGNAIRLRKDIIMAGYSPGEDSSRSGMHGTQHYQYLATRQHVKETVLELTAPVRSGWYGQELPRNKDTSSFQPYGQHGKILKLGDFEFIHTPAHTESVYIGSHHRNGKLTADSPYYSTKVPETFSLTVGGEPLHISSPTIEEVRKALRDIGKLNGEIAILLAKEELIINKTHESIQDFVSLLLEENLIEDIPKKPINPEKENEERMVESGEILRDFGGHFRVMGMANQQEYWVIQPDGTFRDPDEIIYRKSYTSEGNKRWFIVKPEEIAISWSKSIIWANHHCEVNKTTSQPTDAQIETINKLQDEINQDWIDRSIGKPNPSPLIGEGWGFKTIVSIPESSPKIEEGGKPADLSALLALKDRFKK